MRSKFTPLAALLVLAAAIGLAGCGDDDSMENAGEQVDEAAEETADTAEQAADEVEESMDQ